MGLNVVKEGSNMYQGWITHTWNTVKGECPHGCSYCYMKRWGVQKPVRFDEKELKTNIGSGNFIFVGSSCDMFAKDIPDEWINKTLEYCKKFDNKYLFQTKNPKRIMNFKLPKSVICTTIESNIIYMDIMKNSPFPSIRAKYMQMLSDCGFTTFVTIEPIMDFSLEAMVGLIKQCNPLQVNIGSDSGNHHLPEPSKEKLLELINELSKFTTIARKTNLERLLK